jgi:hypothetical protein
MTESNLDSLKHETELAFKVRRLALLNGWLESFSHERGGVALAVWAKWIQDLNDSEALLRQVLSSKILIGE